MGPAAADLMRINNSMKYLIPKARNTVTHETVMQRDLANGRFRLDQRRFAQVSAELLAAKMSRRTGVAWQGFVEEYTPGTVKA